MALKPQRRVVTTHKGTASAIMIDETVNLISQGNASLRTLWQSHEHPALLDEQRDMADESQGFYAKGSLIRVLDLEPKAVGFNHRTASLDYGIIMQGSAEMVLEDGSKTICNAGDVVVQRGTMHQWNNPTDKPTRIIFVLLPAKPPVVEGAELGDSGLPKLPGQH
ncbi:Cupin RmlC-type [Lasiodiplodia theobromae]|uniref:Cupin RmlC-type n=1 Tax=Lasiodiplodia theobromae TaxID=45133 RepID=A0A8H7IPF8_9PEZI|nr:Cupin RmlC-type [Lasiodiplodia theobromae]KAF4544015.1 Cupin RmlC-type [Lasiodiplodia theobromae]KAF9629209.1 Cupin RmlC-type [Lasiodiplodia theobromae]